MKGWTFSKRTAKEILRDPLNLGFGLGFPIVLILMLSAIQANIPVSLFEIDRLTPGITVFGLSFMTLFSATLIARDRETALLQRLYTAPLTAWDFIFGYTLPILPIAIAQCVVCYLTAVILHLPITVTILYALAAAVPMAVFFISLGLLCGSVFNIKQVGGLCGALLTNLTAWFSGAWFDLDLVGGIFRGAANCMPFVHGVNLERAALSGTISGVIPDLCWVLGYAAVATVAAVLVFLRQMKKQ